MIKNIIIHDFRLFKNISINLGKYITAIAGRNTTGKSTLLCMLGNSCELKKSIGVPLLQNQFRTEFSEIFKGSEQFDKSGSNRYRINFCDTDFCSIIDYRDFRISWQSYSSKKGKGKRFRIIPYKKIDGSSSKTTSRKMEWPILYLGLSRLFPIGESKDEGIKTAKLVLTEEEKAWFVEQYQEILSIHDDFQEVRSIRISETERKKGIGVLTNNYDFLANSAGQDNLGQILCAVLSFKKLKEKMGSEYRGGMLLIDELDATLHPAAQNRLVNFLIRESRKYMLQVVFTTHSASLLKHICSKTQYNSNDDEVNNDIEIVYLSNANRELQVRRNPTYSEIEYELLVLSQVQYRNTLKVYTEDYEARWFLKKLIPNYLSNVNILDVSLGHDEILKLYKADIEYFGKLLIVLDGDVPDEKIKKEASIVNKIPDNIITLPGSKRPEEILYDYLLQLESHHPYWEKTEGTGFTWLYFKENGPDKYDGKERDKYKKWFQDHERFFESTNLFDYWAKDNKEYSY